MAKYEARRVLNFLGFFATVLIAIAILIAAVYTWIKTGNFSITLEGLSFNSLPTALVCVANICAYTISAIGGFCYAKSKRNIWFLITQIIAVIIIVFVVLTSLF